MNKTVLVTGGTGKLGRVLLSSFLDAGWTVVVTSPDRGRVDSLVEGYASETGKAHGLTADFHSSDAVDLLTEELTRRKLVLTHLVNNARSRESLTVQETGMTRRNEFLAEFELDVVIPYELTMRIARSAQHNLQAVVNMGSMYGLVTPNPALYDRSLDKSPIQYGVSKAGLHHLTRELAVRLAPQGVRVNCVAFGGFEGKVDEPFKARYASMVPSGRMLTESEVFGPVEFLLGDASTAVNGHILIADAGWTIW